MNTRHGHERWRTCCARSLTAVITCAALAACTNTPAMDGDAVPVARPVPAATPEAPLDLSEAPSTGARRITGEEFRRLAGGNTLLRRMANGGLMAVHVVDDTRQVLEMRSPEGKVATDEGRQTIRDDSVCVSWTKVQAGRELCFAYFLDRGKIVSVDLDARISPARFALQPGKREETGR